MNLRTELWLIANTLLISLLILPVTVYLVGSQLFSAYASGIAGFYRQFLISLFQGQLPALILVLGPAFGLILIRAILRLGNSNKPKAKNLKR